MAKEPKNELAEVKPTALAIPDVEFNDFAGMGTENITASDLALPRLTILQKLSPQLEATDVRYIEDAKQGDFCNVATGDIYRGEIEVIPCHYRVRWIQWKANRKGFVAAHADPSCLANTTKDDKGKNILPNGDHISETAEWFCLLHDGETWKQIFLPLDSTDVKVSHNWMTAVRNEKPLRGPNGLFSPPLFYRSWRLKPFLVTKDENKWYSFTYERFYKDDETMNIIKMDPTKELVSLAKAFYLDSSNERIKVDEAAIEANRGPENAKLVNETGAM
jgi:hypothetical protein